jgi:hypothetical protein
VRLPTVNSQEKLSGILLVQLACLVVVALNFRFSISSFSYLPHAFPLLDAFSGAPGGLGAKSWFHALLLPLFQSAYFLFMAGTVFWVALSPPSLPDPVSISTKKPGPLPGEMKKTRRRAAFYGSLISLLTLLCATYIYYAMLQSDITGEASSRGPFFYVGVALVFAISFSTMWVFFCVPRSLR